MDFSFPSPTKIFHHKSYPAISPTRHELSQAGKRIVITGGGYGIGRQLVLSFAAVNAAEIAILGRKEGRLLETSKLVSEKFPNTKVQHYIADVTDVAAVKKAAESFGKWNVLILNAGYMPDKNTIRETDINEWWRGFEINVKGVVITLQAFLPFKVENAVVIGTSANGISFPKAGP
jgi:NAD(P)-dependent dehydrogenase (short-subunit alcohol dehydrogenase family)